MSHECFSVNLNNKIKNFNKIISADSDKSISIRSFIIGSMSEDISKVKNVLESEDVYSTIKCLKKLGSKIVRVSKGEYNVYGKGLGSFNCKRNTELNFGNSGTAARILIGALSVNPNIRVKLTGDKSLNKRSMFKIIKIMEKFGATFLPKKKYHFPITLISSEIPIGINFESGMSAQIKSAVIMAGLYSHGKTNIFEKINSRDHTEKMLSHNKKVIRIKNSKKNIIEINGKKKLKLIDITVPGDPSSAAFFSALCLLKEKSKLIIKKVQINPRRIGFYRILKKHGAKITFKNVRTISNERVADIFVNSSKIKPLKVSKKNFVSCQDEYPIMFAIASFIKGTSVFKGIEDLKNKESDRIKEMQKIFKQLKIKTEFKNNQLKVFGSQSLHHKNKKIIVKNILDHRILMSSVIIGLLSGIETKIKNFETVKTSSPNFLNLIKFLGGKFEIKKIS